MAGPPLVGLAGTLTTRPGSAVPGAVQTSVKVGSTSFIAMLCPEKETEQVKSVKLAILILMAPSIFHCQTGRNL